MKILVLSLVLFISSPGYSQNQPSVQNAQTCGKDWVTRYLEPSTLDDTIPNRIAACFCDFGWSAWGVGKSAYQLVLEYAHDPSGTADRILTVIDNPYAVLQGWYESVRYRLRIFPQVSDTEQSALICGAVAEVITLPSFLEGTRSIARRGRPLFKGASAKTAAAAGTDPFAAEIPAGEGPQLFSPPEVKPSAPTLAQTLPIVRQQPALPSTSLRSRLAAAAERSEVQDSGTYYGVENLTREDYEKLPPFTPVIYNEQVRLLKGMQAVDFTTLENGTLKYKVDSSYHRPPERILPGGLKTEGRPIYKNLYLLTPTELERLPNKVRVYYWDGKKLESFSKIIRTPPKSQVVIGYTKYGFPAVGAE
jgi:hypothetical protein